VGGNLTNVAVVVPVSDVPDGTTRRQRFDAGLARLPAVAERLREVRWVGPVLAAGPFARRTTRATADRVALVGDAADFYDPFTGEGVYAALRGAELLADGVGDLVERDALSAGALAAYDDLRRREFGRKWLLERVIAWSIAHPVVFERVAQRLAARPAMADLLVGVTGDFVPPREVLRLSYLLRLVL
jgi:flavin-dependent dehydrogenase